VIGGIGSIRGAFVRPSWSALSTRSGVLISRSAAPGAEQGSRATRAGAVVDADLSADGDRAGVKPEGLFSAGNK